MKNNKNNKNIQVYFCIFYLYNFYFNNEIIEFRVDYNNILVIPLHIY